jgi:hypothetical protein
MDTVLAPAGQAAPLVRRARFRSFYVGISLLMTAMVIVGFWPSYFGALVRGAAERPWMFHLHAAVFTGWMGLLVAQVALVAAGRTRVHRAVGRFGISYGWLVLVVGVVMTFYAPAYRVGAGEWTTDQAASFVLLPLVDMVLFAGFFGAAVWYRSRPETHKRLMLLATVALVFAAVARRVPFESPAVFLFVWLSPILLAVGYDWQTGRGLSRTYVVGIAVLVLAFCRGFLLESELWLPIGRALLAPFV